MAHQRPLTATEIAEFDFEDALASLAGSDKGPKVLTLGLRRVPANVDIALPWAIT